MIHNNKQASQLLVSDLAENILRYSDNPGDCATFVTAQIRELIGVRMVAITADNELTVNNLVAICPARKRSIADQPEFRQFIAHASKADSPQIIEANSEIGGHLAVLGIGTSFVVPLKVGEQRVGMLILLDLLDLKGATIILDALTKIASILALILRNSFLYKHMQKLVDARTIQLAKSEQLFRAVFEQANDAIIFLDTYGTIVSINKAFAQLHGFTAEEIKALGLAKLDVEGDAPAPERIHRILAGEALNFEVTHIHKDGHLFQLDVAANLVSIGNEQLIIAIHRDITDRKRAEKERAHYELQLQKSQRLESLGILAGGIAHDFNNLMGGIFGFIDIALDRCNDPEIAKYLTKTANTIDRARALTHQLLTFAKGGAPIQQVGSLFPFVQETAQFALSGSNVSSFFNVPADLWTCNFDKNQIGQVIDNLIINAQQAMPSGGTITVTASNITLINKTHPLLAEGNYVKISLQDCGTGIPKEMLSRIFDPFFTTKPMGHGLGLATCYSIINRHGGCIDVDSIEGKGSTFHVYLPACNDVVADLSREQSALHCGSGTFLIMDDEEVMRDIVSDMLSSLGYNVICKANGRDVVDYFTSINNQPHSIAGMIFDLTIPGGMGGCDAVKEIRKLTTTIPVFVASGYADDPVMRNPVAYGFTASIRKPFRKFELSDMLKKYMEPDKEH